MLSEGRVDALADQSVVEGGRGMRDEYATVKCITSQGRFTLLVYVRIMEDIT